MPPTKDDPLGGDGQDGGEGGLFAKSPPSPPYPLSPSKTLIRENHRELLPRQGVPCPMVSRQGLRRTAFFSYFFCTLADMSCQARPYPSQQLPFGHSLSSFCHAAGRPADKGRPARPDGLRSSRQSFLRDGWGRGGKRQHQKEKQHGCPLSSFCHAAGRLADKGRPARPDGLRYSRQSFLRDGWGARGEEKASKRKTVRDARFLLFAMLPGDWRTRDGLRDRTAYDPPGKVFCGMDGGAGEETASKRKTVRDARFLLFAMLPGDWRTRDDLRDQTAYDPPGKVFLRDGWGARGKRQHQKEKQYEMPAFFFLPCCGRLADKGRPARPDGLRSSRQSFLRDGWGARGEETASKKNSTRCPLSSFCHAAGDWRTRDGLRDQTAYDPPGKVFCGMDGGRGGKEGGFFPKKPPSFPPHTPPLPSNRLRLLP